MMVGGERERERDMTYFACPSTSCQRSKHRTGGTTGEIKAHIRISTPDTRNWNLQFAAQVKAQSLLATVVSFQARQHVYAGQLENENHAVQSTRC